MNLFTTHDNILEKFKHFGISADEMLDFLEMKLLKKGFGNIKDIATCRPDTGTHNTPIFSGEFICEGGTVNVKCVFRKGEKVKHHWAVYIKRK